MAFTSSRTSSVTVYKCQKQLSLKCHQIKQKSCSRDEHPLACWKLDQKSKKWLGTRAKIRLQGIISVPGLPAHGRWWFPWCQVNILKFHWQNSSCTSTTQCHLRHLHHGLGQKAQKHTQNIYSAVKNDYISLA